MYKATIVTITGYTRGQTYIFAKQSGLFLCGMKDTRVPK